MLRLIRNLLSGRRGFSSSVRATVAKTAASSYSTIAEDAFETAEPTNNTVDERHQPIGVQRGQGKSISSSGGRGNNFSSAPSPPQLLINCVRNNIFFCLSTAPGKTTFAMSAGRAGFPGAQKTSPKAALAMLDILAKKLADIGVERVRLNFRGLNPARPVIVGQLRRMGIRIAEVVDTTGVPHNGCRPPKKRRL